MNKEIPSLCGVYKDYFPIGAAVNIVSIKKHEDLIVRHFNSLTADNDMKFKLIHPGEDRYSYEKADQIAEFARQYKMKMRGHTLVWYQQTSDWVFQDKNGNPVSREALLSRMQEHINTVVERYKNDVYCWDTVNEAVDDKENFLLPCKWLDIIGEDYVEKAFEFANLADPNALLFYNEINTVYPAKRDKIIKLLRKLIKKGIPVHGLGIQGHWNIYSPTIEEIKIAMDKYANLGLKLQITELDISLYQFENRAGVEKPTHEMLEKQTEYYENIFTIFRQYRDIITGVTLWGVADDMTWLDKYPVPNRKNWPLLFDMEHKPKDAFYKIIDF